MTIFATVDILYYFHIESSFLYLLSDDLEVIGGLNKTPFSYRSLQFTVYLEDWDS